MFWVYLGPWVFGSFGNLWGNLGFPGVLFTLATDIARAYWRGQSLSDIPRIAISRLPRSWVPHAARYATFSLFASILIQIQLDRPRWRKGPTEEHSALGDIRDQKKGPRPCAGTGISGLSLIPDLRSGPKIRMALHAAGLSVQQIQHEQMKSPFAAKDPDSRERIWV